MTKQDGKRQPGLTVVRAVPLNESPLPVAPHATAMVKRGQVFLPFGFLLCWCLGPTVAADKPSEFHPPEDREMVLANPDMGWVLYENAVLDPASSTITTAPEETFPGVDHVAVMFSWADAEPQPGVYDFRRIDEVCTFWRARGKGIHLRLSTESLLWWNHRTPPRGIGAPTHVVEQVPGEARQERTVEGRSFTVVDAREPRYRAARMRFLRAVAEHFRGDRAVEMVDLRGFGVWGEWHSGFRYADDTQRHQALSATIDDFADAFPALPVALSYSHDPDGPRELYAGPTDRFDASATARYQDFLRYSAFDHALTRTNVTWRRDGVGGAVYSNQRKLCEEAFALGRGPFMSEFVGGYTPAKKGGERWLRWMIDDALSLHPNYVCLLGWQHNDALAFLREQPALVAHGARTMGYRLVPLVISLPPSVPLGQPCVITSQWTNRGVGRVCTDLRIQWILRDQTGQVCARADGGLTGAQTWVRGSNATVTSSVTFAVAAPGRYTLYLHLSTPDQRAIALPLPGRATDGSYPVGGELTLSR